MSQEATARARAAGDSSIARLARYFPDATPVRIPVSLIRVGSTNSGLSESTVIEFGTAREVLFASSLPLEFADVVRV